MTRTGCKVECDIEQQNCEDLTCIFDSLWFHGTELFKVGKILANIFTYDTLTKIKLLIRVVQQFFICGRLACEE